MILLGMQYTENDDTIAINSIKEFVWKTVCEQAPKIAVINTA